MSKVQIQKVQLRQAERERDYWNVIAALFDTRVYGWTGFDTASFANGMEVEDKRIAESLYELAELKAATP